MTRQALAPATDRALAILELLGDRPDGLTLSAICRALHISTNMAFRILGDLAARGYLDRDAAKTYRLGRKLLSLAAPWVGHRNLIDEASPEMLRLRNARHEGVGLLVPSEAEAILIHFLPADRPVRTVYDLGIRIPLYANAPGKVLMAFADEHTAAQHLAAQSMRRLTATTITSRARLQKELIEVRRRGWATDRAEEVDGMHCVAAPIHGPGDTLIAALVLNGPSARLPIARFPAFGAAVRDAADRISTRLRS
jgi:DNA-binding IclR family transcriptional regulator